MVTRTEIRKGRKNFNELLKTAGVTDTKGNTFISLGATVQGEETKSYLISINDGEVDLVDQDQDAMIYGTLHEVTYPVTSMNCVKQIASAQTQDSLIAIIANHYPDIYK